MMKIARTIYLAFLWGAISGVSAHIYEDLEERHQLFKRDLVPRDCITSCNDYSTQISGCSSNLNTYASCLCSANMVNELVSCLECGLSYDNTPSYASTLENSLNSYASSCQQLGYPITVPTLTANANAASQTGCDSALPTSFAIPTLPASSSSVTTPAPASPTTANSVSSADPFGFGDTSLDAEFSSLLAGVTLA